MLNPLKISEMLSQANQMQEEVQHKLAQTVVEGTSGGGAVTATMNGKKQLLKIRIEAAAVVSLGGDKPDVEMLEDLVVDRHWRGQGLGSALLDHGWRRGSSRALAASRF